MPAAPGEARVGTANAPPGTLVGGIRLIDARTGRRVHNAAIVIYLCGDHVVHVTALTLNEKRHTRRKVLLLALPGGRVMGSYDQITLLQAFGTPDPPAPASKKPRRRSR